MEKLNKTIHGIILIFCALSLFGFDYALHSIPINEIHLGGPAKDGIPALHDPQFVPGDEVKYLKLSDRILGLSINGEAKAYPIRILNWHELVNDTVGGNDILVSYCPLCGTGMAFDAKIDGKRFLFGVSGKLYNSDVLMYDKGTESLWPQIKMEAVTGPMTGKPLKLLPLIHTTWGAWQSKYPETKVLSKKTGHYRNYSSPYSAYETSDQIMFPVKYKDSRLSRKEWVLGVIINKEAKAYSFKRLRQEQASVKDKVGGQNIIPSTQAYWFAWVAFYPDTGLYK